MTAGRCCPVIADGLAGNQRPQGSNEERNETRSYSDGDDEVSVPSPTPIDLLSFLILGLILAVVATVFVGHFSRTFTHTHTLDRSMANAIKSLFFYVAVWVDGFEP